MKRNKKQKTYMKWLTVGLVIAMSLVLFADCKSDSGDTKDNGTTGVTQEQNNGQDGTDTTDGMTNPQEGTAGNTDGTSTDNTGSGGTGDGTSDGGVGTNTDGGTTTPPATPASTCTIQINCSLLVGKTLTGTGLEGMETLIPSNGVILGTTKVTLNPGDTVYDVTLRVTKAQKIHMASEGSQAMGNLYISAIANIYEKAYNSRSGWVYLVNGTKPGIGSGVQTLKAGDKLVWAYTLDNGNDL